MASICRQTAAASVRTEARAYAGFWLDLPAGTVCSRMWLRDAMSRSYVAVLDVFGKYASARRYLQPPSRVHEIDCAGFRPANAHKRQHPNGYGTPLQVRMCDG